MICRTYSCKFEEYASEAAQRQNVSFGTRRFELACSPFFVAVYEAWSCCSDVCASAYDQQYDE